MDRSKFLSRQFALRAAIATALLLAAAAAGGVLWLRTSLPSLAETVRIADLDGKVDVIHDRNGVPHIIASHQSDAYRALGYIHARDRLFQMDFMRRLGAGRLSEVVGSATVPLDKTMRTLGLHRLAGETYRRLPDDAKRAVDAYAAGVNAFLRGRTGALPPEFLALRYAPEKWTPEDSLVWGRLMAMRLTGNWRTEALRAALSERLTPDQMSDLWPGDENGAPTTLSALPRQTPALARALLRQVPDWLNQTSASNSWLLSGNHTETGKPLLANDPHLGFRAPGLWYLARISAPGLSVTGATVAGVPFHVLGHNGRIAWAFTTTDSDTQDLFVERLVAGDPGRYDTPTGPRKFDVRTETIRVKDAAAVNFNVRTSRHGPILSDINADLQRLASDGHVIALAAASLRADDLTPLALYRLNRAGNWDEFVAAAESFHAPQQNISYADSAGNIGFIAPGRVPVRNSGRGRRPVAGWTGASDWAGFIPFDQLPRSYNPASGRIVNANHRIVPKNYRWYLTDDWSAPYRARRINDALDASATHGLRQSTALQNDVVSLAARDLLPVLLEQLAPKSGQQKSVAAKMRNWGGKMSRESAEPLIFMTWLAALNRALYADELGPNFAAYYGLRPRTVLHMVKNKQVWCDNVTTDVAETCSFAVTTALESALKSLEIQYGPDMEAWRWGAAHEAVFSHPLFTRIPVLNRLADIRIESGGGPFTVNRAQPRISNRKQPFASVHGPGYRAVYDLSQLANSRFATATGRSGNPLSSFYNDNTRAWRDGEYIKIAQTRTDALKQAMGTTRLIPAR